jgi:hypothetical protein
MERVEHAVASVIRIESEAHQPTDKSSGRGELWKPCAEAVLRVGVNPFVGLLDTGVEFLQACCDFRRDEWFF